MKKFITIPIILASVFAHAELYHVTDLGTLGGATSLAFGINASGQVVGHSTLSGDQITHAFVWSGGTMQDVGSLGGDYSEAFSINESGQIAGDSLTVSGASHAFLISNGQMHDLGTLGGNGSYGFCINASSQIVGIANIANGDFHAFLYKNGSMQDLGVFGGLGSTASGINDSGQIVGYSDLGDNGPYQSFLYSNGNAVNLGSLGGPITEAFGINGSGQVVGQGSTSDDQFRAFLYSNGEIQNLGTLGGSSEAESINSAGVIVGSSDLTGNQVQHAFVYSGDTMNDLNLLLDESSQGAVAEFAYGVNDNGLIVGYGTTPGSGGHTHGLLLTPIAANVIVPDSFTLFRGIQAGGSLYGLQFGDAWYLSVHPGLTLQSGEAPVQVQVSGTSPAAAPASLQFKFTGNVNSVGLSQSLLLYNFTTSAYETVDTRSASLNVDQTVTITASGTLSRFVNPSTKEVRARVAFKASGPTSLSSWTANLGVVNWVIQ